jgi:hypothetical protein
MQLLAGFNDLRGENPRREHGPQRAVILLWQEIWSYARRKLRGFPQPGGGLKPRNPGKVYSEYSYPFARGVFEPLRWRNPEG